MDELVMDVWLEPIKQLTTDIVCSLEDLPNAIDDRDE